MPGHPVLGIDVGAFSPSCDHVADAEFLSDLPQIDSLALASEGGTAGDNHQSGKLESDVMMSSATPSPK